MGTVPCPICKRPGQNAQRVGNRAVTLHECLTCGDYQLTLEASYLVANIPDDQRYLASAILREMSQAGGPPVELKSYDLRTLQDRSRAPRTVAEKLERIGRLLERKQERVGGTIFVELVDDYPLAFALDHHEFRAMLIELQERGYMALQAVDKKPDTIAVRLTPKGYDWIDQHRAKPPKEGNLVFVAHAAQEHVGLAQGLPGAQRVEIEDHWREAEGLQLDVDLVEPVAAHDAALRVGAVLDPVQTLHAAGVGLGEVGEVPVEEDPAPGREGRGNDPAKRGLQTVQAQLGAAQEPHQPVLPGVEGGTELRSQPPGDVRHEGARETEKAEKSRAQGRAVHRAHPLLQPREPGLQPPAQPADGNPRDGHGASSTLRDRTSLRSAEEAPF